MNDKCENCESEFTDLEQKSKEQDGAKIWYCYECIGDGEFTEHGNYVRLVNFLKEIVNIEKINIPKGYSLQNKAIYLLNSIGEIDYFKCHECQKKIKL